MNEMNKKVVELRKYLGLTQAEFAKKINLSRTGIAGIEQGSRALTDRTIADICRVFRVNDHWLCYGIGEMFDELTEGEELAALFGDLQRAGNDDPIKKMLLAFLKLTPEEQEVMRDLMKKMMDEKK